jgi:hypothetical protein
MSRHRTASERSGHKAPPTAMWYLRDKGLDSYSAFSAWCLHKDCELRILNGLLAEISFFEGVHASLSRAGRPLLHFQGTIL